MAAGLRSLARTAPNDFCTYIPIIKRDYIFDWANRLIIREIQRFIFDPKKLCLMILAPPRMGKSELTCCLLPTFLYGSMGERIMFGKAPYEIMLLSYSHKLCRDFTRTQIQYMTSPDKELNQNFYQLIFPKIRLAPRGNKYGDFKRSIDEFDILRDVSPGPHFKEPWEGGLHKKAASIITGYPGTTITGRGGDLIILDDLIRDLHDANWALSKEKKWAWYDSVVRSRLQFRHGLPGKTIILNTRWSHDDIPGRLLEREPQLWDVLRIPAFAYEADNPLRDSRDNRKPGEVISKRLAKKYAHDRLTMANMRFVATHQQMPTRPGGEYVKGSDIQFYTKIEDHDEIAIKILTADLAYAVGEENDFSVFQVWGMTLPDHGKRKYFLLDQVRGHLSYGKQKETLKKMSLETKNLHSVHIEDIGGRAKSLIEELQHLIVGMRPWKPPTGKKTGKMASKGVRLQYAQPMFEHQQVYFPDPAENEWVNVNIDEITMFPKAKHDDTVDATTMAIEILNKEGLHSASFGAIAEGFGKIFDE